MERCVAVLMPDWIAAKTGVLMAEKGQPRTLESRFTTIYMGCPQANSYPLLPVVIWVFYAFCTEECVLLEEPKIRMKPIWFLENSAK